VEGFYAGLGERGLEFGAAFQQVEAVWRGDGEAVARVRPAEEVGGAGGSYVLHPALLDACFQPVAAALGNNNETYIPVAIGSVVLWNSPGTSLWSHVALRPSAHPGEFETTVRLFSDGGELAGEVRGLRLQRAGRDTPASDLIYSIAWQPVPSRHREVAEAPGIWLIVADSGGLTGQLTELLKQRGHDCLVTRDEAGQIANALLAAATHAGEFRGVVYMAGLDAPALEHATDSSLREFEQRTIGGILETVQQAVRLAAPPRLYLVTRGSQPAGGCPVPGAAAAPLWGLGKSIATEHPEFRCVRIDLDPDGGVDETGLLANTILSPGHEDQMAFRAGVRLAPRLIRGVAAPASADDDSRRLCLVAPAPGLIENLQWKSAPRRCPGPDEVEIRVRAAGLNFRDVLVALGLYPGSAVSLGGECSGTVERVGAEVRQWHPGDEVIAFAPGNFGTFATVGSAYVMRKPGHLTWVAAATIPVAYLTAAYGLIELARLKPGERVLIHAAAGGVGLAAVQLARALGAEIYATAGSEEKRAFLRSLGVPHVMASRTLDFAAQISELTSGQGVDVALNSLAGEFIPATLASMARDGRFLEIGKRGIPGQAQVRKVRRDLTYRAYDLREAAAGERGLIHSLFRQLQDLFPGGVPSLPVSVFSFERAVDAFRLMAAAKHIGKVVLVPQQPPQVVERHGTYLITGGLGGLGLHTARWLVKRGARNLVLMGRRGVDFEAQAAVRALEDQGVRVLALRCDVSDREALREALETVSRAMPPLRGIVHAAGVLEDHTLLELDASAFERVMAPKVAGARNLYALTRESDLQFLILFSSSATVFGSAGQANYVSANSFLDAFAGYCRAHGRPATAIAWGPWSGSGMSASLASQHAARMTSLGFMPLAPEQALDALDRVEREGGGALAAIVRVDWPKHAAQAGHDGPLFDALRQPAPPPAAPVKPGLIEALRAAPASSRRTMLIDFLGNAVRRIAGIQEHMTVDAEQPLREMGVDSLMAVELRNLLSASLNRSLPATLLFDHPTLDRMAAYLTELLVPGADRTAEAAAPPTDEIVCLSEEEAESLLLQELNRS